MEGLVPRFELDTPRVNSEAPIGLIKKTSTKDHPKSKNKDHQKLKGPVVGIHILTSSPPPFLITCSLPALVIKCPGGLLTSSPSALALCSTLLLFLPFTLSLRYARYSSLFQL